MISPAALSDLAPTGRLRIAIMYTNPMLASGSPAGGNLRGIAYDLAQELGRRVNVPLDIVGYETSAARWADQNSGKWDVTFSAHDPKRAGVTFTPPYMESEGTFLVPPGSRLRDLNDIDSDGIRIAVSANSSLDMHLSRSLNRALLERIPGASAAAGLLIAGKADALAGLRMQLMRIAATFPGSTLLEGRFMAIRQALALPVGRNAGMQFLRTFVEDIKASGLVARIIGNNGIQGVIVSAAHTD